MWKRYTRCRYFCFSKLRTIICQKLEEKILTYEHLIFILNEQIVLMNWCEQKSLKYTCVFIKPINYTVKNQFVDLWILEEFYTFPQIHIHKMHLFWLSNLFSIILFYCTTISLQFSHIIYIYILQCNPSDTEYQTPFCGSTGF